MQTREDFEVIKQQVSVETVANYLLEKQGHLYKFPDERTASIRIYSATQSFYDFGRSTGGDVVRLWAHVRGCDSWTALQEIKATFRLSAPDRTQSRDAIIAAERARKKQLEAQKQKQERWVQEVDRLKKECEFYQDILDSGHFEPLSWAWCLCKNWLTTVNIQLDLMCRIN